MARAAGLGTVFIAAAAALLLDLAPAAAQTSQAPSRSADASQVDLSGRWLVKMVDGPSKGDHAVVDVAPATARDGARFYDAEMRFTDSRTNRTAFETCVLKAQGRTVTVRCATDEPFWAPDDFDLTIVSPNRMRGKHTSAVSGVALFYRDKPEEPTS